LLLKQKAMGNKWAEIAKEIEGRTENQVKNRFNSLIKKIKEEKTYSANKKRDIKEALTSIQEERKEGEVDFIEELIERKRKEIEENPQGFDPNYSSVPEQMSQGSPSMEPMNIEAYGSVEKSY